MCLGVGSSSTSEDVSYFLDTLFIHMKTSQGFIKDPLIFYCLVLVGCWWVQWSSLWDLPYNFQS